MNVGMYVFVPPGASQDIFLGDSPPHFSRAIMRDVEVRYNTFGRLNEARDNVMVVCHALTGNARLDTWWSSLLGPGQAFDTDKYFVVCANILGEEREGRAQGWVDADVRGQCRSSRWS